MLRLAFLMEFRERLGARMRALREEEHLRAEDVAVAVGCTPEHLWGIERGQHWPGLQLLLALAIVYRVEVSDFFTFPGSHPRHTLRELLRNIPTAVLEELTRLVEDWLAARKQTPAEKPKERSRKGRPR